MEDELWSGPVLSVLIVLLGAPMGSFAALLAERLPRGLPVGLARSRCGACGGALRWWELVPILSFLALRGRCACCRTPIPARLLEAELAGLALGGLAVWAGLGPAGAAVLWCLLALILSDLWYFRLPDRLSLALLVLALPANALAPGLSAPPAARLGAALIGAAVAAGLFLALALGYRAIRRRAGMGAGDIRLMAGIGALVVPAAGWTGLAMVTLIASLAGLALALMRGLRRGRAPGGATRLPFGACLGMAAIAVWAWTASPGLPGLVGP